jgi:hypothetical protein
LVSEVCSYFKREEDAGMPVHDVAKAQERAAEACDILALEVCKELLAMATSQFVISLSLSLSARHPYLFLCHFGRVRNKVAKMRLLAS